jgi:hypothetical protein
MKVGGSAGCMDMDVCLAACRLSFLMYRTGGRRRMAHRSEGAGRIQWNLYAAFGLRMNRLGPLAGRRSQSSHGFDEAPKS